MRAFCVLLVLLLLAASGLLGAPAASAGSALERLLDAVGGPDMQARYPAYQELLKQRDTAWVGPLLERLDGWDLSAQSYGVSLLQTLGADAGKAWDRLLGARGPFLRAVAAQQLLARESARAAKVLVEALEQARVDPGALQMILARLGGVREPSVLAAVRAFVRAESSEDVLGSALTCLGYADDVEVLPQVRALVRHAGVGVRALAAAFLLRGGEEEHAPALAAALGDDALTYAVFLRLKPWLEASARVPEPVAEAAAKRAEMEAADEAAFAAALIALVARLGHTPAVPALRRLLKSPQPIVSKAAFDALASLPEGLSEDDLRAELAGPHAARRLAAADALRRRDDLTGLPVVLELARAGSPERGEAVRVLGGFRVPAAVDALLDALLDENISTRAQAFSALGSVWRTLFPYRRLDLASTGYDTQGADATRAAAVARLREWWGANRDALH